MIRASDRVWAWGTVTCTALISAGISLFSLLVSGRLPGELATNWDETNTANGFQELWGVNLVLSLTAIALSALVCGLAIAGRGESALLARVGVGLGMLFSLGVNALHLTLIVSQLDVPDPALATLSLPLMVPALAVAVLGGALVFVLYRPQPAG